MTDAMVYTGENWDERAREYQRVFSLGLNDYNAALLRFWHEEGMLRPGYRVLDIGCGVGKYGTYLAELGYEVTLTDLSEEMLRHASENMSGYQTPWTVYQCDFREATGKEPVFADGFDLAISTMSPAVCGVETVRKMSNMTHGWCFLARFQSWEQPVRDELIRRMGFKPSRTTENHAADVDAMIQAVRAAGYEPFNRFVPYNWSDGRSPAEMADTLCRHCYEETDRERIYDAALTAAKEYAGRDGRIHDAVNTTVAWIYWKTPEKSN